MKNKYQIARQFLNERNILGMPFWPSVIDSYTILQKRSGVIALAGYYMWCMENINDEVRRKSMLRICFNQKIGEMAENKTSHLSKNFSKNYGKHFDMEKIKLIETLEYVDLMSEFVETETAVLFVAQYESKKELRIEVNLKDYLTALETIGTIENYSNDLQKVEMSIPDPPSWENGRDEMPSTSVTENAIDVINETLIEVRRRVFIWYLKEIHFKEKEFVSSCCSSGFDENEFDPNFGRCKECKDHCEIVETE